jgi:Metallo-beta-lactamase-like, C-terminal domain
VMFRRSISPGLLGFATGEALAHLNWLIHRHKAVRELDAEGVAWYRSL